MPILIVPRGFRAEYYEFLAVTTRANGDELVVDRRTSERRRNVNSRTGDRRGSDRRGPPPVSWVRDGVIVLAGESGRK